MTSLNSLSMPDDDPDPFEDDDRKGPDPRAFVVLALARSRRWVIGLVALGAAIGLVFAAAQPNTYTSEAKLLLRLGAREDVTAEDIAVPGAERRESRPTMQDELHMLRDATIYESVAEHLGPEMILAPSDPTRYDGPETSVLVRGMHQMQAFFLSFSNAEELAAGEPGRSGAKLAGEVIVDNTNLATDRDSNVITVTHTSTSPERAQQVTDGLTRAFIERHRSQFSIRAFLDTHRQKVLDARGTYESARKRFYEHVEQCGFVDLEVQGEALMDDVDAVERELFTARTRRDEIASERKTLAAQLANTPPLLETKTQALMGPNPEFDAQLDVKSKLLEERDELAVNPDVSTNERARRRKEFDDLLKRVDEDLKSLPPAIVTVPPYTVSAPNPEHTTLKRRIDDLDVDDQGLLTKTRKLDAHLKAQQGRLDQLAQCKNLHGMMDVSIEAEKDSYKRLAERYAELEALSNIDLEGDANLRVLQAATLPYEKDGPDRKKVIALGIFAGCAAGTMFAFIRQLADRRLRYPSSIERQLDVVVLAVVPEVSALAPSERRQAS
jgi:uncharacterized protein involved in exopolysaccharide biosynthesis